ncbi:MAG TPA: hypothetical protein VHN77_06880, partial [Phycisphaerales bacterium]|nr:hypothetical protein [Phycisphaerales bacterium]
IETGPAGVGPSEYQPLQSDDRWPPIKVTVESQGEALEIVLQQVASDAGVSIVMPTGSLGPCNVTLLDVPLRDAVVAMSRGNGFYAACDGQLIRISRPEDTVSVPAVIPAGFDSPEDFVSALTTVLGAGAKVQKVGDRVVVLTTAENVQNVKALVRDLSIGPDGWVLDVRVVQVSDVLRQELGIDWRVGASFGAAAQAGVGIDEDVGNVGARVVAGAAVDALFKAARSSTEASFVTEATAYLVEGREVNIQQGDVVPVPMRTVSDQGTVTVTGFRDVATGFEMKCKGRRVDAGLLLEVAPKISNVSGFVEGAPIISQRKVESIVVLQSGQWTLVSGLEQREWNRDARALPNMAWAGKYNNTNDARRSTVVLVRAVRVFAAGVK